MDRPAERLARGDPAAFAELYDACADRVHHYLVALVGSRADADDVLQETFVRLARMRKSLGAVDNLLAYVFATARNEATDWPSGRSGKIKFRFARHRRHSIARRQSRTSKASRPRNGSPPPSRG
jgi:RNA polymerase sigma factor (sigma-70 family)